METTQQPLTLIHPVRQPPRRVYARDLRRGIAAVKAARETLRKKEEAVARARKVLRVKATRLRMLTERAKGQSQDASTPPVLTDRKPWLHVSQG